MNCNTRKDSSCTEDLNKLAYLYSKNIILNLVDISNVYDFPDMNDKAKICIDHFEKYIEIMGQIEGNQLRKGFYIKLEIIDEEGKDFQVIEKEIVEHIDPEISPREIRYDKEGFDRNGYDKQGCRHEGHYKNGLNDNESKVKKRDFTKSGVIYICLGVIGVLLLSIILGNYISKNNIYTKATGLMRIGQYNDAVKEYRKIKGFKDSDDMVNEAQYQYGKYLQKNDEYYKAIDIFKALQSFKDSESQIEESHYLYGLKLIKDHQYEKALKEFNIIPNYKDVESQIKEITYQKAIVQILKQDWKAAQALLDEISNYKGANQLVMYCNARLIPLEKGNLESYRSILNELLRFDPEYTGELSREIKEYKANLMLEFENEQKRIAEEEKRKEEALKKAQEAQRPKKISVSRASALLREKVGDGNEYVVEMTISGKRVYAFGGGNSIFFAVGVYNGVVYELEVINSDNAHSERNYRLRRI